MTDKRSHSERVLLGRPGAYTAHSRHSAHETTGPARRGFESKLEPEVDPRRGLGPGGASPTSTAQRASQAEERPPRRGRRALRSCGAS